MKHGANKQVMWCCGFVVMAVMSACGPLRAQDQEKTEDSLAGTFHANACTQAADCGELPCGDGTVAHELCVDGQCVAPDRRVACPGVEWCDDDNDCKEVACFDGTFRHDTCVNGRCAAAAKACPLPECVDHQDCKEFVCGDGTFRHELCQSGRCAAPTTACP